MARKLAAPLHRSWASGEVYEPLRTKLQHRMLERGVVSLFAHKKYDSLTVEYLDNNGGSHGATFRLRNGQGQTFKKDLVASGAHVATLGGGTTAQTPAVKNENK